MDDAVALARKIVPAPKARQGNPRPLAPRRGGKRSRRYRRDLSACRRAHIHSRHGSRRHAVAHSSSSSDACEGEHLMLWFKTSTSCPSAWMAAMSSAPPPGLSRRRRDWLGQVGNLQVWSVGFARHRQSAMIATGFCLWLPANGSSATIGSTQAPFVLALSAYHGMLVRFVRAFAENREHPAGAFFR